MEYSANINGIEVTAFYSDTTVREIFIPLLERLAQLHTEKQSRILVMLAAPPGAGKSTLVSFLEKLAKDVCPEKTLQAVGMDGFHRRQEYLLSHTANVNGREIPMVRIKGAPVTFDLEGLRRKISELTEGRACSWPRYDRLLHNPVEDAILIEADIVLLEGNYLLLDSGRLERAVRLRGLYDLPFGGRRAASGTIDRQKDLDRRGEESRGSLR